MGTLINIAVTIQDQMRRHKSLVEKLTSARQRKEITAFIQAPSDYFDAEPTFMQSYAPQAGAIFGILKQMKETFETNLETSQKEEMASQTAYDDLSLPRRPRSRPARTRRTRRPRSSPTRTRPTRRRSRTW